MSATALIQTLQSRGFGFQIDGDHLFVSPSSQLTDDDRRAIREYKADLLALLSEPKPAQKSAREIVAELIARGRCPDCCKPMDRPTHSYGARVCWECCLWLVGNVPW